MTRQNHIAWIDLLRITACFMVVLAHQCGAFVAQFLDDRASFLTGVSIGSLMRASVPLFVMITAVLLLPLPEKSTVTSFYRRRLWRITPGLIFWSIALPVFAWLYFSNAGASTANPTVDFTGYSAGAIWTKIWTFIFNFNFDTTPLWYLYMLAGLYFIIPVVGSWLRQASRRDVRAVLWVWFVSLFVPYVGQIAPLLGYVGNYGNMGLFGVCDWNPYGTFYYLSGFLGYVILAYYLKTWPPQWSAGKCAAITVPSFIVGYLITFLGFVEINNHFTGQYAMLEMIWYFCSINVVMMTVPMFIWFSRISIAPSRWLSRAASLTFGIYLCHFVFVFVAYDWLAFLGSAYWLRILLGAFVTFGLAGTLTWIFTLTRPTRALVA